MNKVLLTGRIANEIEIRKTQSNKSICEFNLAVDKGFKDSDGNRQVDFILISCWNNNADYIGTYATKGTLIEVVGRIITNNYEKQDGTKVYKTFVSAESTSILKDGKNEKEKKYQTTKESNEKAENEYKSKTNITFKDDDLPFY